MSRTFRRKNHHDASDLRELAWVPARDGHGSFLEWQPLERGTLLHAQRKAAFHADNHPGTWNAPRWYRRVHTKAHRARCNRQVRLLSPADDVILDRRPSQANWTWF